MPLTNIAVIGASGGIGQALVAQLSQRKNTRVYAFARRPQQLPQANMSSHPLDITDEASVREAAGVAVATGPLDLVILATGLLHEADLRPEKSLQDISMAKLARIFAVNTFGPALVMKHFLPAMQRQQPAVFAALSARVGSIADNRLGGWYAYRSSKAALNMLLKTASLEMRRLQRQIIVVGLHPGTVATDLSAPFQNNVAANKLLQPDYSASRLLAVIEQLESADSGQVFAWDGAPVPH